MKKVQAYLTEDGKVFLDQAAAAAHEDEVNLHKAITEWTNLWVRYNMSQWDIVEAIIEHFDELVKIVKGR